jgi:lipopolysaccharide transport system permease protein
MLFLNTLIANRALINRLAVRDVASRYKGSVFGLLWSFFTPLLMLAVYSFVFGLVFKARWSVDTEKNFALILFVGLMFHSVLAESLVKAPGLILSNVNYVKKVVFPIEILAWTSVLGSIFNFIVSIVILFFALLLLGENIYLTWLYLPIVVLPLVTLCLGISWLLASLGVYIRDISQITTILSTILLFLCPIFYPIEVIPVEYQGFIMMNPLTFLVDQARAILIFGAEPNIRGLALYSVVSLVFCQLAFMWFQKTKRGFADVL